MSLISMFPSNGGETYPNGTEWSLLPINKNEQYRPQLHGVAYGNGLFVGRGSRRIYTSTNGINWTTVYTTPSYTTHIYYADGRWMVCTESNGIFYSTNGSSWTQGNMTETGAKACVKFQNKWIAVTKKGIFYSTDASSWIQTSITDSGMMDVAAGNDCCVATANNGIYFSTNGTSWTKKSVGSYYVGKVYYSDGVWIVCVGDEGVYKSTNGSSWTLVNITNNIVNAHKCKDKWFVAAGSNGIYYSTNGSSWTQATGIDSAWGVYYANGIYIIRNSDGVAYSTDGVQWTPTGFTDTNGQDPIFFDGIWLCNTYYSLARKV